MADEEFDIGAAFDEILGEQTPVVETPVDDNAAIEEEFDAQEAAERARDEKGRFVKKDADEPINADKTPLNSAKIEGIENAGENEAPLNTDKLPDGVNRESDAPANVPREIREAWADIPESARSAFARREGEIHELVTRFDAERQRGRSFDQLVAPYQDMIAQEGGNPISAAAELFETARLLRNPDPAQRAAVLNLIASRFNIDIEQAYYSRPDPQVAQRDLQLMATNAELANYRAAQAAQAEAQIATQIEQFAATHEHFHVVSETMTKLILSGLYPDLQSAYDHAIATDETLRSTLIEQAVQERLAAEEATRAAQVAKARRAAISPTSAPGTAKPPGSSNLPPEELIAQDYDRIMAALE